MFAGNDRFSMKSKLYARENLGSTKKTKKQIKTNKFSSIFTATV